VKAFPGYWYKIKNLNVYRKRLFFGHHECGGVVVGYMTQLRLKESGEIHDIYVDMDGKEIFPVPTHFAIVQNKPSKTIDDEQEFEFGGWESKRKATLKPNLMDQDLARQENRGKQ
jgi:hypothetical protein